MEELTKGIFLKDLFIYKIIYLFISLLAVVESLLLHTGFLQFWCMGFSLPWLLVLQIIGSWHAGFSIYGTWTQ